MEDIINAIRPTSITKDWIMERIVQIGSSPDVIDLFMHCITWDKNSIESDTIEGIGRMQQSVANFFMDSNIVAFFVVITKCGNKLNINNMVRYLFLVMKKHWESKLYRFILDSRKDLNETNYTERQQQNFDGTEQPMTNPPSINTTLTVAQKQKEAETASKDKNAPLYANEWVKIKEYRKTLLKQLKRFAAYVTSWKKPDDMDSLISEFGLFLQNTMHLSTNSLIYSELKNVYVDLIENTGTLVDTNGIGADPLFLKFTRPTARTGSNVVNLNGKLFRYLRQGYLDQWYAWASQFWLENKHRTWYSNVLKYSKSQEHEQTKRGTELVLIDETSSGASRYCMYGLVSLNYPSLRYVRVFRRNDPWYVAPEFLEKDISVECTVKITNGNSDTVRQNLLMAKQYVKQLKTMFYTSNFEYIGFCLVKNIPLHIENMWGDSISIASLRERVLYQPLVGPLTRYVKEETRILTYTALMCISASHGLPMYVAMGWNNVTEQWNKILKENTGPKRPSSANKTCSWLARRTNNGIVLNQPLLYTLFVRLLNHAFTPDKKVVKGDMDDGYIKYLKKHYMEMKEEGRIGSGKVKPRTVTKSWNPFLTRFSAKRQKETSSENFEYLNNEAYKLAMEKYNKEKQELQEQLNNIIDNRDFQGELKTNELTIQRKRQEIQQTEATILDLQRQLKEEIKNPSLTIPMVRNIQKSIEDSIQSSMERIETLEGDIIKLQKEKISILEAQNLTNIQIRELRDKISNLPLPDKTKYNGPPRPTWDQSKVFAPRISEEALATFTEEEKKMLQLDTYEWMYAQRLRFVSEYYAPSNIDKLVEKFKIRFKDWTGESNISINI